MLIDTLPVGPLRTNSYLVTCEETRQAVLIDPGWSEPLLTEAIQKRNAKVVLILNTHAHWDHMGGNAEMIRQTGARLAVPAKDLPLLRMKGGADVWDIPLEPSPEPDLLLNGGETIEAGNLKLEVLSTPGHTPGHISLFDAAHHVLFDGDVLFQGGIGRTDLPGGSMKDLSHSIRDILFRLPADTVVYPGHGPSTTIGDERQFNPWMAE